MKRLTARRRLRTKPMRNLDERLKEAVETLKFTNFPVQVVVETTAFCNLKCGACPSRMLTRKRGEMDFSLFTGIVDEISAESPDTELYPAYMGEPLLYKDLFRGIRYAKDKGLSKIYLNTNAMLMSDEACSSLLDCGVDRIIVSIDGFSDSTYEARRIGGVYETVRQNTLNLLRKTAKAHSNLEVWVQMIVDEGNECEEERFQEFWLPTGAIVKIRPQLTWGGRTGENYLSDIRIDRVPCPWLMRQIVITWNGQIAMCDADHEAQCNLGAFTSQSIKEVWNTSFKNLREKHLQGDFSHHLCRDCHDWKVGKSRTFHPNRKG